MTYTWWTLRKTEMAMEQRRMALPESLPNAGVSGAALNPAKARLVIPAQGIVLSRIAPKSTNPSKIRHRKMEKPALMRGRQNKRLRMITTCLPPKTRQASATMNSSYQQTPSNKSVFNTLKKKQQQLRADQDLLADRWTEVLAAEEYEL